MLNTPHLTGAGVRDEKIAVEFVISQSPRLILAQNTSTDTNKRSPRETNAKLTNKKYGKTTCKACFPPILSEVHFSCTHPTYYYAHQSAVWRHNFSPVR